MVTNIVGQVATTTTASADRFTAIQIGASTLASSETGLQGRSVMPCAGTLQNFYVSMDNASGAGITRTFVIRKNGVDQSMSVALAGAGSGAGITTGNDTVNTVSFVAGDTISIHTSATATTGTTGKIRWTLGANCAANTSMLIGNSGSLIGTASPTVGYVGVQGQNFDATTPGNVESVMPTNGTINNLYVQLSANVTATANWTFTLFQNGSSTGLTCTLNNPANAGNDTAHSVSVSAGDKLYWKITSTTALGSESVAISAQFSPTIDGESVQMFGTTTPTGTTNLTRFMQITSPNSTNYQTTDALVAGLTQACTWQKLYVVAQSAVTSGSITVQPAIGGTAAGPSVLFNSGNQTSGNDTSNTTTSTVGQNISMRVVTVATTIATVLEWGVVSYIAPISTTTPANDPAYWSQPVQQPDAHFKNKIVSV